MIRFAKACLDLWSSAEDGVRIAAFLAIRQLASAADASILDLVLKVYPDAVACVYNNADAPPEYLPHASPLVQVDECPYSSFY